MTMELPRLNTHKKRVVGFAQPSHEESPSSVLRDSPPSADSRKPAESPLSSALRRELSAPALPKLKLLGRGGKKAALGRSKSHGNLQSTQPAEVPQAARSEDEASPHASSGGSEPVRIPFEFSRRRTHSVDFTQQPAPAPDGSGGGAAADRDVAATPVISAASSLIGHHLEGLAAAAAAAGAGSAAGSPLSGGGSALLRTQSAARDLFAAQADAVMAHAQAQHLQAALRREQEEVLHLREQLAAMTAERDRLLAELAQGGGEAAPLFLMDAAGLRGTPPQRAPRPALHLPAPAAGGAPPRRL